MITVTDTVMRTMCASTYYISTYSLLDTRTIYIGSVYLEWQDLVTEPRYRIELLPPALWAAATSTIAIPHASVLNACTSQ